MPSRQRLYRSVNSRLILALEGGFSPERFNGDRRLIGELTPELDVSILIVLMLGRSTPELDVSILTELMLGESGTESGPQIKGI